MQPTYLQPAFDGTPQQIAITAAQRAVSRACVQTMQLPPPIVRRCRAAMAIRMDELFLTGETNVVPEFVWALEGLSLPDDLVAAATVVFNQEAG